MMKSVCIHVAVVLMLGALVSAEPLASPKTSCGMSTSYVYLPYTTVQQVRQVSSPPDILLFPLPLLFLFLLLQSSRISQPFISF